MTESSEGGSSPRPMPTVTATAAAVAYRDRAYSRCPQGGGLWLPALGAWLGDLGFAESVTRALEGQGFRTVASLLSLADQDLRELGFSQMQPRKVLLAAIDGVRTAIQALVRPIAYVLLVVWANWWCIRRVTVRMLNRLKTQERVVQVPVVQVPMPPMTTTVSRDHQSHARKLSPKVLMIMMNAGLKVVYLPRQRTLFRQPLRRRPLYFSASPKVCSISTSVVTCVPRVHVSSHAANRCMQGMAKCAVGAEGNARRELARAIKPGGIAPLVATVGRAHAKTKTSDEYMFGCVCHLWGSQ